MNNKSQIDNGQPEQKPNIITAADILPSSRTCTKRIVKCSFFSVLKSFGFKLDGNRGDDVKCYVTKDGKRYAEILKYNGWSEVWVVGENIPCNSTMSYPGGSRFVEPVKLLECLQNCT